MNPTNREIQLQKTCQLYAYVLISQGKEVPEDILECSISYDYPVECVKELAEAIENLDTDSFETILNNKHSQESRDLLSWWNMYQTYIPIDKS